MSGYRGFNSRKEHDDYYSDPAKYADEIPAMKQYADEARAEREAAQTTICPKMGKEQWTCKPGECVCHLADKVNRVIG